MTIIARASFSRSLTCRPPPDVDRRRRHWVRNPRHCVCDRRCNLLRSEVYTDMSDASNPSSSGSVDAVLKHYAEQYCEGWCKDNPPEANFDDCGGCRARLALRGVAQRPVDSGDVRWAVNVLLEKIAAKFEANDTYDIWRSDAAATVRSFKHDLTSSVPSTEGK